MQFQVSIAVLPVATLTRNFAKPVRNPHAAARAGAPQAVQTADRFHLVKNVAEAVQKALARCGTQMRKDRKEGHGNDRRPLIRGVSPIPCDF